MIRLLILDDDIELCQTLARRIKHERYPRFIVQTTSTIEETRQMVAEAIEPFDIFLFDLRLEADLDGIQVMQELHRASPSTDGIIMIDGFSPNTALRAYEAGASRYLSKPFETDELVLTLRSVYEKRRTQDEREWLKVLTEVTGQTLRTRSLEEVGELIVQGACRLGFERARLWIFDHTRQLFVGMSQAGHKFDEFTTIHMPVDQYCQYTLKRREPSFFYGLELGQEYLDRSYDGFQPPVGEWVNISLWADERCLGMLTLDNADRPTIFRPAQRDLLRLFGQQAAGGLERALTYQQEQRERQETEVLNQISRHVASRAAVDDLQTLLEEIRRQISTLIDVNNFRVVLRNEEAGRLEYWLEYENGVQKEWRWSDEADAPPANNGLIAHLIVRNEPLFAPTGTNAYRQEHGIVLNGPPSRCWISVPLALEGRAIGLLVLDNNEQQNVYTSDDLRLLELIASQIAGVIHIARTRESDNITQQQLDMLHRGSEVILKLAEENEDWMWHFTLTAATANYGVGFNRAFLFLRTEDGHHLRWALGIGHLKYASAENDWQVDQASGLDFEEYLARLHANTLNRSPLEIESQKEWRFSLDEAGEAFLEVLNKSVRKIVRVSEVRSLMPCEFVSRFGETDYALVPLRTSHNVLGLLVVDNIFTQDPLLPLPLYYLDTFLDQAALTYEILTQQRLRDRIIKLNYRVLADMHQRPLKAILEQICQAAQEVTRADSVIIYPFKSSEELTEYDVECIASVGLLTEVKPSHKQRHKGVTGHILRGNELVIDNVSQYPTRFDGQELAEHSFLKREKIEAFIGVRVDDVDSKEVYGLLYLNYRSPQTFTLTSKGYAESFATLAAVAIRNARSYQTEHQLRQSAEASKRARETELTWLQSVSEEALTPQADEPRVIKMLLNATYGLLNVPRVRVQVVLRAWEKRNGAKGEPREIRRHYSISPNGELKYEEVKDIYSGIIGEVLREERAHLVQDVRETKWASHYEKQDIRSKLTVLIRSDAQLIGILNVTAPQPGALTESDQQILNRLVGVASLALDNVLRQKHLYDVFRATKAVTKPLNLRPTLDAITEALFDTSPSLSALTIWYKEPEDERLKLGSCYGIRDEAALNNMPDEEMEVVRRVMNGDPQKGIWIQNAAQTFGSRFMEREQIKSAAAFPLFANDERVGAMFLFYRLHHKFTDEQRGLFPILAASVAASVLDASRLELVRSERKRFQAATAITEKVGTSLDLSDTLHKVMTVLQEELFPDTNICVMTYDQQKQALLFTPVSKAFYQIERKSGANSAHLSPKESTLTYFGEFLQLALNQPSIATRVAKASLRSKKVEVANVADVTTDPDFLPAISGTRSEICISLMGSQKQLFGVLVLESPTPDRFDAEDQALLIHVGRKISLAMERVYQSAYLQFQTTVAAATSWAAEIAHDLNSEMGLIRNRLDWLREDEQLSQSGLMYIEEMEESLSRLDGPLASVKAFQSERPRKVSLKGWIKDAVNTIIADKHRTHDTEVTFEVSLRQLTINVTALRSAMRYFINNALDQIEGQTPGRLVIRARVLETAPTSAGKQAQKIELQIEDSGSGVDDTIKQTLFQQPRSTKRTKGHGFGLLFARHLIEQMGGTLYLTEPTTLNGACFAFTVPIGNQK